MNTSKLDDLVDNLWGRALDMTSPDFANDDDYLKAQTNYCNHCKKELEDLLLEAIGEYEDDRVVSSTDTGEYERGRNNLRLELLTKLGLEE